MRGTERAILERAMTRRHWLKGALGAGGVGLVACLPGCGDYPTTDGAAYAPWAFPAGETAPDRVAVAAAILASNPHNTQPWLFRLSDGGIELHADLRKALGPMDPLTRELWIGLGCALENLCLALKAQGRTPTVTLQPDPADETFVARVEHREGPVDAGALYRAIPRRHTNRGPYGTGAPPAALEGRLRAFIQADEAVSMAFIRDGEGKARFKAATVDATRAIIRDREMNEASHRWWRQTAGDIRAHRDGLTMDATGLGSTTRFFGKVFPAPDADGAGAYWLSNTKGDQTTCAAFVVLSSRDLLDRAQQLQVGRAYQRMHLWLASEGWAAQPLNQLAERRDRELELGLAPWATPLLAELAGGEGGQMLFRVGVPWDEAKQSPRRPVGWVLTDSEGA